MSLPCQRAMTPEEVEHANAILSDLEREVCNECRGTGHISDEAYTYECDVCCGEGSVFINPPDEAYP